MVRKSSRNKIIDILDRAGLTQTQLAIKSGLSVGTVNKIANGDRPGTERTRYRIINSLSKLVGKKMNYEEIFLDSNNN